MDTLDPFRRWFRVGAAVLSFCSACLTGWFGLNQSPYMGIALFIAGFMVVMSLMSDYIGLFLRDAVRRRQWDAVALCVLGAFIAIGTNVTSNFGSIGWQRASTAADAGFQNTAAADVRKQITNAEAERQMFATLRQKLVAERPWAAEVKADGLRNQIADLRNAEAAETKLGGCGRNCRAIQDKIAAAQGQIASAEKMADYDERIASLDKRLAELKASSAEKPPVTDAGNEQAGMFATIATMSLAPTDEAKKVAGLSLLGWIALGLTFGPMVAAYVGWKPLGSSLIEEFRNLPDIPVGERSGNRTPDEPRAYPPMPKGIPAEPIVVHTVETIKDESLRRWALSDEVRAMLGQGQLKAA